MKKNLLKSLLLLFLLLGISQQSYSLDYFQSGKDAFYKSNFTKAYMNFRTALKHDPGNVICRYYYAQTLIYTGNVTEAKKEYTKIIGLSPLSKAADYSRNGLVVLENFEHSLKNIKQNYTARGSLAGLEDNYIDNALSNASVVRWDTIKMPLKVYIDKSGTNYAPTIKSAFNAWFSKLGQPFSFVTVNDLKTANIIINFATNLSSNSKEATGYIGGLTTPKISNNVLESVQIQLATAKPDLTPINDQGLYNTVLHEIGHSLGIYGHSAKNTDVMYPIADNTKKATLSNRDINTIKVLYKLDADVSNNNKERKESTKNNTLIGFADKRQNKKLKESLDYVKLLPYEPLGWTNLASQYSNMNKETEAIKSYKKALTLDPKYNSAREGLVNVYIKTQDYDKATTELKTLIKSNPKKIEHSKKLAVLYVKLNNKTEAKNVVNNLISKNPKAKDDADIKNLILNIETSQNTLRK